METVNLLLPLTVALLLSFSPAAAIECHTCDGAYCPNENSFEKDCGNNTKMCVSGHILVNGLTERKWMGCADPKMCLKTGSRIVSMTHKVQVLAQIDCCNTDLCNKQAPPIPSVPVVTLTCLDHNKKEILCNGRETSCFKTGDSDTDTAGCSSPNACADKTLSDTLLGSSVEGFKLNPKPITCGEKASEPESPEPVEPEPLESEPPEPEPVESEPPEPLESEPPEPLVRQCQMCLNPCRSCSETTTVSVPQGMKCVAATVKDSVTGDVRVLKAIAGAPLCSGGPGPQTFALSPISLAPLELLPKQYVQVTCCEEDNCNRDVPEFDELAPVQPVSQCANPELASQLHLLVSGAGMLPPSDCNGDLDPPN